MKNNFRKVKKWLGKTWTKTQDRALILVYHRITEIDSDPQLLCVSPENFSQHLQIIKQFYKSLSLTELAEQLSQNKVPHRSVIITFDDGYADNLHQAQPFLKDYNIPATVFVSGSLVGQSQEFWWDDLERLLLQPGNLPEKLSLSINNSTYDWELGTSTHYSEAEYERDRTWNVMLSEAPTSRHQIYRSLCSLLRPLPTQRRQEVLQQIVAWANADPVGRVSHRALTLSEVKQLAAGGLIEVGAHTMTHPVLAATPYAEQLKEIQQSKEYLESLLEQSLNSFAYPYGGRSDYTQETVGIVEEVGLTCACSNFPGVVLRSTNQFQLPRFLVRNWSGEEFALHLKRWFDGET